MQPSPVATAVRHQDVFPVKQGQCWGQVLAGKQLLQNLRRNGDTNRVRRRHASENIALRGSVLLQSIMYLLLDYLSQAATRHHQGQEFHQQVLRGVESLGYVQRRLHTPFG